jgi:hypothetical protein
MNEEPHVGVSRKALPRAPSLFSAHDFQMKLSVERVLDLRLNQKNEAIPKQAGFNLLLFLRWRMNIGNKDIPPQRINAGFFEIKRKLRLCINSKKCLDKKNYQC